MRALCSAGPSPICFRHWLNESSRQSWRVTVSFHFQHTYSDTAAFVTVIRQLSFHVLAKVYHRMKWNGQKWQTRVVQLNFSVWNGRFFKTWDVKAWIGLMWLRIGTGGGHLWMRQWAFGFHKMQGISWLAENRLASQEGLCSMEWISKIFKTTPPVLYLYLPSAIAVSFSIFRKIHRWRLHGRPSLRTPLWIPWWPCVNGSTLGL